MALGTLCRAPTDRNPLFAIGPLDSAVVVSTLI